MNSSIFYHIYPLGMCGAPERNDFTSSPSTRLKELIGRIPHLSWLGITALYLGPVFESTAHGYDTADYRTVDRRLGVNADLVALVEACHAAGISVVLDAVLNHTGRDFFAFRDLRDRGLRSEYRSWYKGVDFSRKSPAGDTFDYEGWSGHYDLAKLDTENGETREYLLATVEGWIRGFGIDGLRLDAADVLSRDFMDALSARCKAVKGDFWLMGEVVHGDYRDWARPGRLDSVTNYELYKGLWSCLNDANFFELAWSLNRQSGSEGMYRDLALYTFVDNHDVNRAASVLKNPAHLPVLYTLLFSSPGIPSLYYGSEWGLRGEKRDGSDAALRPAIRETADHGRWSGVPAECAPATDSGALEKRVRSLVGLRKNSAALARGSYRQVHLASEQFAFVRETVGEKALVAVNSSSGRATLWIHERGDWTDTDAAADGSYREHGERIEIELPPYGCRILIACHA